MDFLNFFNYVNYLHQEHLKLKQTYENLLCIVVKELPEIKARLEAYENIRIAGKKTPHREKRLVCQFCGENYDEEWKLETHLVIHEEAEKFPCNVCNKEFQTNWRLVKHLKNHQRKDVKICKYFKRGHFCPFEEVGCKFSHCFPKLEKEKGNIPNDEADKTTTMINVENESDHKNEKNHEFDCQGCGQFPSEFECVKCDGRYCSECISKDHMQNLHYCLNCEDDVDL